MKKILRKRELAVSLGNKSLLEIWSLLNNRDKFILKIVIVFQALLSFLDLIGVALIGVIGALSVYGIQSQDAGNLVKVVIDKIGIGGLTFQNQILILSALTVSILSAKTVASLWITRRSLSFISRRGAKLSGFLVRNLLTKPSGEIHSHSSQELIYSATTGVGNIRPFSINCCRFVLTDYFDSGPLCLQPNFSHGDFFPFFIRRHFIKPISQE